jgi:hypothetical protein
MGIFKNILGMFDDDDVDPPETEYNTPNSHVTQLQARLFIKTINDFQGTVDNEYLFIEVVSYAVNLARYRQRLRKSPVKAKLRYAERLEYMKDKKGSI